MNFRNKIIQLRYENNLSQQQLAEKLDVSRQTISRWEAGKSIPSANQISVICDVFHLSANDIIDTNKNLQMQQNTSSIDNDTEKTIPTKKKKIGLIITISAILFFTVVGLIVTICYAVKDASYDASATVWIVSIPQNTPMIVLSIILSVLICVLFVLLIKLFRGTNK
jgi:DNA-binding XRE family transcriptional regulator